MVLNSAIASDWRKHCANLSYVKQQFESLLRFKRFRLKSAEKTGHVWRDLLRLN